MLGVRNHINIYLNNHLSRPENPFTVPVEHYGNYAEVLLDRDGVLAPYGQDINTATIDRVNEIIRSCTDTQFRIVTNGSGSCDGIEAPVIRTSPPRMKQFPGVLAGVVAKPADSLLVTDGPTEAFVALMYGFDVAWIRDGYLAHPYEERFRELARPFKPRVNALLGDN